jgi:hypothetical protein
MVPMQFEKNCQIPLTLSGTCHILKKVFKRFTGMENETAGTELPAMR